LTWSSHSQRYWYTGWVYMCAKYVESLSVARILGVTLWLSSRVHPSAPFATVY